MSIVIDLPNSQEARLRTEAARVGISVSELVTRTIAERFPTPTEDDAQALALIEQWLSQVPTEPDQIRAAEEDLLEFQRAINATRREAGARIIYPDVEPA